MIMYKVLHPRDDIDRLYISRKEVDRELTSIDDYVDASIQGLDKYIKNNRERSITTAYNSIGNISTSRKTTKTTKQKCEEKQLYGYFKRQNGEFAHDKKLYLF